MHDLVKNRDTFIFGGVNSGNYGAYLTDIHIGSSPRRDVSSVSIAGRNGDLIVDNHRWHNLDITYSLAMLTDFAERFDGFKTALLSQSGYHRLTDTIYPNVYRMAMLQQPIEPEAMRYNRTGRFDITFNCKPQRFLISGEFPITFHSPGSLYNDYMPALPLITVYGSGAGAVTIGSVTVRIKSMADMLVLDCDLQNAYRQVGDGAPENKNSTIYAPDFPQLLPGENAVSFSGGVTKIEIVPRWWML